jgi:DNA invertase Pin-like site-specific DNA recombinase
MMVFCVVSGTVLALVVVDLSRLGSNTGDLGRLLDHLDEHGIGLQILNLGVDSTTAAGRLVFVRSGLWLGGRRPRGCRQETSIRYR